MPYSLVDSVPVAPVNTKVMRQQAPGVGGLVTPAALVSEFADAPQETPCSRSVVDAGGVDRASASSRCRCRYRSCYCSISTSWTSVSAVG